MTYDVELLGLPSHVWLNGTLLLEEAARVSVLDRGYLYGDGLFETMRAYEIPGYDMPAKYSGVFRFQQHFTRLSEGARALQIDLPFSQDKILDAIKVLLRANGLTNAYLRLAVSRGAGVGPTPPKAIYANTSIIARPLGIPSPQEYAQGWSAVLTTGSLVPDAPQSRLKTLSYLDKLLAKAQAKTAGANEAILFNHRGEITEASTSNLFLVSDGKLLTPSLESGLLPGVTRDALLEIAPATIQTEETCIQKDRLMAADEVFLTNSVMEIMPITQIEGRPVGNGRPGPVTSALQKAYMSTVEQELYTC